MSRVLSARGAQHQYMVIGENGETSHVSAAVVDAILGEEIDAIDVFEEDL